MCRMVIFYDLSIVVYLHAQMFWHSLSNLHFPSSLSHFCFDPRCRVTPSDGDASPTDAPGCSDRTDGATGSTGATALPAASTLSLPVSQGKPSLRRIKGRLHRSKSLDSLDLLDSNVSLDYRSAFRSTTTWTTESWFYVRLVLNVLL